MSKIKLCECGCDQLLAKPQNKFIWGHNFRGRHHTMKAKEKISKNHADFSGENHPNYGKHLTEETKKKISDANKNPSPETRRKISIANSGKHCTEETKKKMSRSHIGIQKGKNNPNYGKHPSAETKRKMSASHIGFQAGKNNPMFGKPAPKGAGAGKGSYSKKGHWTRSTWERNVADFLFDNGIEYQYEPRRFTFNSRFSYLPDFYIPQCNLYIEVKGYLTSKSKIQHTLFVKRRPNLLIIDKNLYPNFEEVILFRNTYV